MWPLSNWCRFSFKLNLEESKTTFQFIHKHGGAIQLCRLIIFWLSAPGSCLTFPARGLCQLNFSSQRIVPAGCYFVALHRYRIQADLQLRKVVTLLSKKVILRKKDEWFPTKGWDPCYHGTHILIMALGRESILGFQYFANGNPICIAMITILCTRTCEKPKESRYTADTGQRALCFSLRLIFANSMHC